ncbi:MAG: pantetheine-phosphate adenylyltransferase [Methylacidiphilales bacterium]|nr:pantetheine-phosphate adenylyltransferase [Candidatus Methylacidiphilales bacterium]
MSKTAIYPGTFDPITLGHIDIVQRASMLFDHVVLAISANPLKKTCFSVEERVEMSREALGFLKNVQVDKFHTLAVDFATQVGAKIIVRGLRAISDFDYEIQMASINSQLEGTVETIFLSSAKELSNVSSSMVKQITFYGGDYSKFVHPAIIPYLSNVSKEKLL